MNKLIFCFFLSILTSCKGQEIINSSQVPIPSISSPRVIKNFAAAAVAPDFDTTLVSQYIRSIFQDSRGHLWFGTIGEGVVRYDGKTLTYFSSPDGFHQNTVYAINEDKNGNLWFGTDQGVYKYGAAGAPGKSLPTGVAAQAGFRNYNQKDGLSQLDITRKGILVDQSGRIWIGTHGGVFKYNPSADTVGGQSFSLFNPLPPINVTGILEDQRGNIWIASSNRGVFRYDGVNLSNIAEKEGLGDNYAGGLAEDKAGNMWFTMKNGICKFDGHTLTEYTPRDGLCGTEFWGLIIEASGIIWVTARGCTTRFDPSLPLPHPKAFTVFTSAEGLTCCVQSMYQDRAGNMWWGAGQGLFRFDGSRFYQVKKNGPW